MTLFNPIIPGMPSFDPYPMPPFDPTTFAAPPFDPSVPCPALFDADNQV